MKKLYFILTTIFLLITISIKVYAWVYPENDSGYPYRNYPADIIDQWHTFTRNCTSYVMWRINQSIPFDNTQTGPNGNTAIVGNAANWDEHISYIGYNVDNTPEVGNPVNWEAYSGGAFGSGHVAWVEKINSDNSVFISEWNWNGGDSKYNERDNIHGDHYLHLLNNCMNGNIIMKNKIVNNGQTFNCKTSNTYSINVVPEINFQSGSNVHLFIN